MKLMGDGALVEFRSVVDAVKCALAVQRGMGERNVEVPDDQGIVFRIGINLGDVIIEGDMFDQVVAFNKGAPINVINSKVAGQSG